MTIGQTEPGAGALLLFDVAEGHMLLVAERAVVRLDGRVRVGESGNVVGLEASALASSGCGCAATRALSEPSGLRTATIRRFELFGPIGETGLTGAVDSTKRSCKVSTGAAWIEEQSSTHSVDMLVACADNALHLAKLGDGGRTEVEAGEAQSAWRPSAEPSPQSDVSPDDNLVGNPLVFATRLERLRACVRDD